MLPVLPAGHKDRVRVGVVPAACQQHLEIKGSDIHCIIQGEELYTYIYIYKVS